MKTVIPALLIPTCFALLSTAWAQLPSPSPDGGYANNNTAEGTGALFSIDINAALDNTGSALVRLEAI